VDKNKIIIYNLKRKIMKHSKFHLAFGGIIILLALWIISCKQEQNPINPTGSKTLGRSEVEYSSWSTPVNLGPVINSTGDENRPAISKDELSLFIGSTRPGGLGGTDIWVSERVDKDSPWGPLQNLGANVNSSAEEISPTLSIDEHWLYFASSRPGGCGGLDLYKAYRHDKHDNLGWEPAVNLGCVINSAYDDAGPTLYEDEETGITTMYFASTRPGGLGDWDIYASILRPDGTFGPAALVPELSSPARDTRTAIRRRDGLEMIISSGRPGGVGGEDLWVSTRTTTLDPWSAPVNLGPTVNSTATDGGPALSFDGTILLFTSNRPGGFGNKDIWMSTRTKLHEHGHEREELAK
jgi:hypothetical protein